MPFVDAMCIVIAEDATVILRKHMRQKKVEVVFHDLIVRVNPNLFAKYADALSAPKSSDIIGVLAEFCLSYHSLSYRR